MSSSSTSTIFPLIIAFFLFSSITAPSYSARILLDVAEPPQPFQHPSQPSITFIMQNIVPKTNTIQQPPLPFSKPLRTIPLTYGGIPSPYQTSPDQQNSPTQTFDVPKFGIAFATTSKTLEQELEFGSVTNIDEQIYDGSSALVGKARGVYVAMTSSENGNNNNNSHMMAMTVSFSTENNGDDINDHESSSEVNIDSLKLFGVHKRDALECHVAVIGGTGKFKDANGFAAIHVVSRDKDAQSSEDQTNHMTLTYKVYLS